ncbi:MAG: hypothetical protein ABFD90_21635 [Phycisphaerales bacterium]
MLTQTCELFQGYGRGAIVFAALLAGGCGIRSAPMPTYMRPDLLYLTDQTYTRLYVEVDVMEGIEVPQKWSDELEGFLARYCSKPNGITIVRDRPVPASALVDLPMDLVAIMCTDGPPADQSGQPAYLHVVFYDSNKWSHQKSMPPHVVPACPTAILCDMDRYFRSFKGTAGALLRHEAGHILGLCRNREHGDGTHCRNHGCLMERTPALESQIVMQFGVPWKGKLCGDCERDLGNARSQASPSNLSFAGPFLVRHEDEYDVVRLPRGDALVIAPTDEIYHGETLLERMKERIRSWVASGTSLPPRPRGQSAGSLSCHQIFFPTDVGPETARFRTILSRAAEDPSPSIRKYARAFLNRLSNDDAEKGQSP